MAAAWELVREGREVIVLEREPRMGGLARTLEFDVPGVGKFRSDIGPHRFFSKNPALYRIIEDVLGERWLHVGRYTRFHVQGHRFQYPPRLGDSLRGLGLAKALAAVRDLLLERLRDIGDRPDPQNFEDFVVRRFGRTLAEFNMLNYTEKIWGIPCRQISPDWASQRIEGITIRALLRQLLGASRRGRPRSMTSSFRFPEKGSGMTYEAMRERIEASGKARVIAGANVIGVHRDETGVRGLEYELDGARHEQPCSHVVSTMVLHDLVSALAPAAPAELQAALRGLRHRAQVYVFLMLDRPTVSPDSWMYFPDAEVPFGRFHEPRNFSPDMAPPGKTSLWLEHFTFEGEGAWEADEEALVENDIEWLIRLGYLDHRDEVLAHHVHRERNVYPIYDLGYRERLDPVLAWLEAIPNLYLAGRGARFKYTNQDHSMEMGILAARSIVEDRRLDIGEVASGKESFEKGERQATPEAAG